MSSKDVVHPARHGNLPTWPLDDMEVHVLFVRRDELDAEEWTHGAMTNSHWRLYYNQGEGALLKVAGCDINLIPERVYLVPPGLTMTSYNSAAFVQTFVHFDVVSALPVVLRELFPGPTIVPSLEGFAHSLVELGQRVTRSGFPDLAVECLAKAMVYQAFAQCLDSLSPDHLERCWMRIATLRPVMPALQLLHEDIATPVTNAALARLCHMSEDHFIRRFRETVGASPAQYVLKRRIALATQRLLFTDESIDEIAQKTGFSDRFYFSRVFARQTGMPPATYRHGPRT